MASAKEELALILPERRTTGQGSSWYATSFILANLILGVGVLNFSAAYRDAGGILTAVPIHLMSMSFIIPGLLFFAYCSDICGQNTCQDTVRYHGGPVVVFFCYVFIFIHNFGACITFLVILADQLDQVMLAAYGSTFCHYWYMSRYFTLPVCGLIFILPFCFPMRIDGFKFTSVLGVATTVYLMVIVIFKYFTTDTSNVVIKHGPDHWTDVYKVVPAICFSYEGHIEAIPMYSCLIRRNIPEFGKAVCGAILICTTVYVTVGCFGYLTFGQSVHTDLLTDYYPADVPVILAQAMVGLKAVMTYPVVFFCARLVIDDLTLAICGKGVNVSGTRRRVIQTLAMFVLSISIALFVPSIGSVIALLGGSAALFIFIFPGICFLEAHMYATTTKDKLRKLAGCLFIVVGTFVAGTTVAQSISRYTTSEFSEVEVFCV